MDICWTPDRSTQSSTSFSIYIIFWMFYMSACNKQWFMLSSTVHAVHAVLQHSRHSTESLGSTSRTWSHWNKCFIIYLRFYCNNLWKQNNSKRVEHKIEIRRSFHVSFLIVFQRVLISIICFILPKQKFWYWYMKQTETIKLTSSCWWRDSNPQPLN